MEYTLLKKMRNSHYAIVRTTYNHIINYPTPINFSYAYSFGSLVGLFFALQILTGAFLAMYYMSSTEHSFGSLVNIMINVNHGWLMRYMHANGASMVFICMYLHIGRGLYYRSFIKNRSHLWWSGILIFLVMVIIAFIGYVLPWGQMSFWGATVITSLVTAVPFVGENISHWIWGGFSVTNLTLIRFFSLHYLLPFIITAIIALHLVVLHSATSTNPLQIQSEDKIPFHPYYTMKDAFAFSVAFTFFMFLVHFYPNILGHSDNFIPANPLVTPVHIVPEWYFTPFYAILRSCPDKLMGVILMIASILILAILPYYNLGTDNVPGPFSSYHRLVFPFFVANFFILMFLGGKPAFPPYVYLSVVATITYFWYILFQIPVNTWFETNKLLKELKDPVRYDKVDYNELY